MIETVGDRPMSGNSVRPTNPFIEFKKEDVEQSIPARFEQMVKMYPDRMAVKAKGHEMTYRELNRAANQVAHEILARVGEGEEPIALLFGNDVSLFAAALGVLKAGKIIVSLDPLLSRARLSSILNSAQPHLILTDDLNISLGKGLAQNKVPVLGLDELRTGTSDENLELPISSKALAWILYTSGSTGEPKGVIQNHRNLLHDSMNYCNGLHICVEDRVTKFSNSLGVIRAVRESFGALLNGAGLCLFDVKGEGTARLGEWLAHERITVFQSVASLFRNLFDTLTDRDSFPGIRIIMLGGEAATQRDLVLFKKNFSLNCIFVNGLGTTETGSIRRFHINKATPTPSGTVPVGFELEDKKVLLFDEDAKEVDTNGIGEIAIRSRYLSPGYWRRPDLTEEVFLPDPDGGDNRIYLTGDLGRMSPEGCLEHLGRKDFQVQIRGYRVETAEIETVLLEMDEITNVVVDAKKSPAGDQRLVAYFVSATDPPPKVSTLQDAIKNKLPDYMVPSAFVLLESLPLTPTGKADRLALPDPGSERPELASPFVAPRTSLEKKVAEIWTEYLDLDQVGVNENFLELGGNSLQATQIISRIRQRFDVNVSLRSLFEAPTVADMSAIISAHVEG
jgi:amino acid adenylation domain-containing protein